jgi:hypothetical protein
MKTSSNKKETQPSDNRENTELRTKNENEKTDQQVIIDNVAGNVTNNITYHISVENLITAEEDETRNKKKKSCLERLKEIHVAFKILAVLLGIFITLSPFIPKIINGTGVETSTTANMTITTTTTTTAITTITTATLMPTTTTASTTITTATNMSTTKGTAVTTASTAITTAIKIPTTTMTMKKVKNITSLIPSDSL